MFCNTVSMKLPSKTYPLAFNAQI